MDRRTLLQSLIGLPLAAGFGSGRFGETPGSEDPAHAQAILSQPIGPSTPYMGTRGPKFFVLSAWAQRPSLHPVWKGRGVPVMYADFAEFTENYPGSGDDWNRSIRKNGMFQVRRPIGPNYGDLKGTYKDYRAADKADDRVLWWPLRDEPEQENLPIDHYEQEIASWQSAPGPDKLTLANYNGGNIARQQTSYFQFLDDPRINMHSSDSYPWHGYRKEALGKQTWDPGWFVNQLFFANTQENGQDITRQMVAGVPGTFTAAGLPVRLMHDGPFHGRKLRSVGRPVFGNLATGRCDLGLAEGNGQWQPGRFLRLFFWDMVLNGVSGINLFPQCPSTITGQGSVSGSTLTVTAMDNYYNGRPMNKLFPPLNVYDAQQKPIGQIVGGEKSGGPGQYQLQDAVGTKPQKLFFNTPAFTNGDDSNKENLRELATCLINLRAKLEAHPQGGNMLMDGSLGGRAPFLVMDMPSSREDPNLFVDDMSKLTPVPGTGTPGWPTGFRGAEFKGADGRKYRVVLSYSTAAATRFSYRPWEISGMPFGPCEVKLFTDASQVNQFAKAGVDD